MHMIFMQLIWFIAPPFQRYLLHREQVLKLVFSFTGLQRIPIKQLTLPAGNPQESFLTPAEIIIASTDLRQKQNANR